ncbi:MFS transporter [Paradesulfitobacterium ferrireducens]|uniref:MFS transporter n=1 Tax=Paradesulfitobacterium ferrireducens TaxID=2816476 RepID=UPI001F35ECC6|nr:MFS transporter [Paradesulfitobacterium ferrireducens]
MSSNPNIEKQQPLWTKDFILITLANFFIFLGFQMLLPVLPVYATKLGGTDASAGLVVGVFTLSAVLMRPIAGRLLDQHGRKGVYLSGLVLFLLSVIAYHWVPTVLILLVLRFIHGFGWGAASTASGTIASDIIPKARLGEGMGFFGLTNSLSMALAPALGLSIMKWSGFDTVFIISTTAVIMTILLAFPIKYHTPDRGASPQKSNMFEKAALLPGVVILFVTMTYGSVVAFIALYADSRGVQNIGLFFTVYAIALMVSRPAFGRLADRKGYSAAIIPGMLGVLATMLILYFSASLSAFLAAAVIYGLGFGAVQPSLQAMAVRTVPPFRRGSANATFMVGFDLGIGLGSMIWGAVAELTGYQAIYLWAMVPAGIAILLYVGFGRARERQKHTD